MEYFKELLEAENFQQFPLITDKFKVIEDDTVLVVADEKLKDRIRFGHADWREIQRKAVSVGKYRVTSLHLPLLAEGIYDWNVGYDGFLGIMSGVLACRKKAETDLLNC